MTIKLKDCREKLKNYIAVSFVGNEIDEKYNEKIYKEGTAQLNKMVQEKETEQKKYEEQDQAIDNHCNKVLSDLSSNKTTNLSAQKEFEALNLKLGTLQREI